MTPPRPSVLEDSGRRALTVAIIVVIQAMGAVFFTARPEVAARKPTEHGRAGRTK